MTDINENDIVQRFEILYPAYDYSLKTSKHEKDTRRKKKIKTMY